MHLRLLVNLLTLKVRQLKPLKRLRLPRLAVPKPLPKPPSQNGKTTRSTSKTVTGKSGQERTISKTTKPNGKTTKTVSRTKDRKNGGTKEIVKTKKPNGKVTKSVTKGKDTTTSKVKPKNKARTMAVGESGGGKKSPPKNSGSEKFRGRNPKAKTQAVGESGGGAKKNPPTARTMAVGESGRW